jgi:hypothetical protein
MASGRPVASSNTVLYFRPVSKLQARLPLLLAFVCISSCGDPAEEPATCTPRTDQAVLDALGPGCQEDSTCTPRTDPITLIDQSLWQAQPTSEGDPLAEHRPGEVVCPEYAWEVEGTILEVDTGACNYLSVVQPSQLAIRECDTVQVTVSHFNLYAPEPAEGHVAVALDGDLVLDEVRAIPHPSDFIYLRWQAKRAYPAGVPVVFHVHNHGVNEWQFVDISVGDD